MLSKEEFLIELEKQFDNSSWSEINELVNKVVILNKQDTLCNSIIDYVKANNRITFKQWKILRIHVKEVSDKKFKHGS